jgi:opacity protein-like surface antigen
MTKIMNTKGQILSIIIAAVCAGAVSEAIAVGPGFYIGGMTGPASNTAGTQYVQVSQGVLAPATPKSSQWGSRFFMGYKINQYAGAEGGLSLYSKIKYNTKPFTACSDPTSRVRDFDVVGRGSIPFGNAEVFGKAGVALVYLTTSSSLNSDLSQACGQSEHITKFRPTVSVGASYDLSQNWVIEGTWTRTAVGGPVSNLDNYALGISYHFVNVYCGQFLC